MVLTPAYLIRLKREEHGMTRRQLAEGMCSTSLISEYELGNLLPTDARITQLCERLSIDETYFKEVVSFIRTIYSEIWKLGKMGMYEEMNPLFKRLAILEGTPVVHARYTRLAGDEVDQNAVPEPLEMDSLTQGQLMQVKHHSTYSSLHSPQRGCGLL